MDRQEGASHVHSRIFEIQPVDPVTQAKIDLAATHRLAVLHNLIISYISDHSAISISLSRK